MVVTVRFGPCGRRSCAVYNIIGYDTCHTHLCDGPAIFVLFLPLSDKTELAASLLALYRVVSSDFDNYQFYSHASILMYDGYKKTQLNFTSRCSWVID